MWKTASGSLLLVLVCIAMPAWAQEEMPAETPKATPSPTPAASGARKDLEENQTAITAKKAEIEALDKKIETLRSKRDTTQAEAGLIADQLSRLRAQLQKAELELKQTQLSIHVVREDQQGTEQEIAKLESTIGAMRLELKTVIRSLYEEEQKPLLHIFFTSGSLGDMLAARATYQTLQDKQADLLRTLQERIKVQKQREEELAAQQFELGQLHDVLAVQSQELDEQEAAQATFLKAKRQQQLEFDHRLVEAKQARQEIEQKVFTLKSAGVKLTLTEATDMAKYAGKLTGVRPAVLLGVLKVETNLGTNLGSGVYPDDMHPGSREAFLRVTKKLGLDPSKAPISARPRSYQGWGGAMGPGQFMPATWEGIEGRVAQLMNKPLANPYELTDAFVATAIFLADRGGTARAGEYEAVNRYLAGPNWQRFTWYGDRVLAVAAEYEKSGL